jgi:dimethylhistidine N-methyltransferase
MAAVGHPPNFTLIDLAPASGSFLADVLAGLRAPRKMLPPKYFYDAAGARLFDAICELPEYYPTRTEIALLQRHGREMADALGADSVVVEYGSGSGQKTRLLLAAARPAGYCAIDISAEQLESAVGAIARDFPATTVVAVCADYSRPFALPLPAALAGHRRSVFFPGSTVGNFTPEEAVAFLRNAHRVLGAGGGLLIGVDLQKDKAMLDAAYDDAAGVTARFNLNLLHRMNRELGADFDPAAFRHCAFYDPSKGRVEMHLVSCRAQQVRIGDAEFRFGDGETIHTENSWKYTVEGFAALGCQAGFAARRCWVDDARLFSVHYMEAV